MNYRYLYDDIAYVIYHSKKNQWLRSWSKTRSTWVTSITEAKLFKNDEELKPAVKFCKSSKSHRDHCMIRQLGIIDD